MTPTFFFVMVTRSPSFSMVTFVVLTCSSAFSCFALSASFNFSSFFHSDPPSRYFSILSWCCSKTLIASAARFLPRALPGTGDAAAAAAAGTAGNVPRARAMRSSTCCAAAVPRLEPRRRPERRRPCCGAGRLHHLPALCLQLGHVIVVVIVEARGLGRFWPASILTSAGTRAGAVAAGTTATPAAPRAPTARARPDCCGRRAVGHHGRRRRRRLPKRRRLLSLGRRATVCDATRRRRPALRDGRCRCRRRRRGRHVAETHVGHPNGEHIVQARSVFRGGSRGGFWWGHATRHGESTRWRLARSNRRSCLSAKLFMEFSTPRSPPNSQPVAPPKARDTTCCRHRGRRADRRRR